MGDAVDVGDAFLRAAAGGERGKWGEMEEEEEGELWRESSREGREENGERWRRKMTPTGGPHLSVREGVFFFLFDY